MIPHIMHQVYLGPIPAHFANWRKHMLSMHPVFRHHLWTEENIGMLGLKPEDYEHATKAGSSNIVRLHAVKQFGGLYLDMDVQVIHPLDSLFDHQAVACRQSDGPLCNAVFGAEADHPWVNWQIENLQDFRLHDAAHACHVMTAAPVDGVTVLEPEVTMPWNWNETPDMKRITRKTLAIHWFTGSWCK